MTITPKISWRQVFQQSPTGKKDTFLEDPKCILKGSDLQLYT